MFVKENCERQLLKMPNPDEKGSKKKEKKEANKIHIYNDTIGLMTNL